jgi:hypothetical protein
MKHVVVTDVAVMNGTPNGLATAIFRDLESAPKGTEILSTDAKAHTLENAHITPAQPVEVDLSKFFVRLFDVGLWPYLHQNAYTSVTCPPDVLHQMFSAAASPGSIEALIDFGNKYSPPHEVELAVHARFKQGLEAIQPGSQVHFHGFGLVSAAALYAPMLAKKDCGVSLHIHEFVAPFHPDSMIAQDFYKDLAAPRHAGINDYRIFVHTDEYRKNLAAHGLLEGIEVQTFRLGADTSRIMRNFATYGGMSALSLIESFHGLAADQQNVLTKIEEARQQENTNRFVVIDRCDPIKGTITGIRAIREFLEQAERSGSIEKNHFVLLLSHLDEPRKSDHDLMGIYREVVRREVKQLLDKFSDSVSVCSSLKPELLPWVIQGANLVSFSTADGLLLAPMEAAYTNVIANQATAVLMGDGAGLSKQLNSKEFPSVVRATSGDVRSFVEGMQQIVRMRREEPETLKASNIDFVNLEILSRKDSMVAP